MAYDIVSFDGVTLNAASGIVAKFPANTPWERGINVNESNVRNFQSSFDSLSVNPWVFDVELHSDNRTLSYVNAIKLIEKTFNPFKKVTRSLVATYHDGTTQVFLDCYVSSLKKNMDTGPTKGGMLFRATLHAIVPFWQSVALNSSTTSPITNAGNTRAFAKVTLLNGGVTANYKVFTVTDTSGRGLVGYPVLIASAITSGAIHYAFVNGVSVPTLSSTTSIWVRVDVVPGGTSTVTTMYGANLPTNPLQDTLSLGSMSSGSSLTSATMNAYDITTYPIAPLTYRPTIHQITSGAPSDSGFENTTLGAFVLHNPAAGSKNDANAMVMTLGSQAGTLNALGSGFSRVTTNHTAAVRSFIRYRVAGSVSWIDAWTQTGNATVTTAVDIDNAVEIVAGIEYTGPTGTDGAQLVLSGSHAIALNGTPTVTNTQSGTARVYNGNVDLVTSGTTLTFSNYAFPTGTLTFDCNADPNQRSISNSNSDTPVTIGGFSFDDPVDFLTLDPGANTWSTTLPGTPTITVLWRDSYI
jgi:hypothetical protein